jgi:hypothetical protein
MAIASDRLKERWRELPRERRRAVVIGVEVAVAIALLLWVRTLGWGFAYLAGVLWTLRIRDDRIRWTLEATIAVLTLAFLLPLGLISVAVFALAELPDRPRRVVLPLVAVAVAVA